MKCEKWMCKKLAKTREIEMRDIEILGIEILDIETWDIEIRDIGKTWKTEMLEYENTRMRECPFSARTLWSIVI